MSLWISALVLLAIYALCGWRAIGPDLGTRRGNVYFGIGIVIGSLGFGALALAVIS